MFRAFHKLLEISKKFSVISQKFAQKLLKKQILWVNFKKCTMFRAFHKLLEISKKFSVISQKFAQKLLKKQPKVAFGNESCS